MLEVGGKGISDRGLARICNSGRQAVATSRRRRTKRVVQNAKTGTNAARKLRFGTKGPYKNKVDLAPASKFWHGKCRESPRKTVHVRVYKVGDREELMAYIDHSGELKPTKDLDSEVWGKPTILGELKFDYIQQTLNCKFDRVEDLHQAYLTGANPPMGIELFRQVKVLLLPASTLALTHAPAGSAVLCPRS